MNGRGMPGRHPSQGKVSGAELILTPPAAGAKFSDKTTSSRCLHGVGVSVVNALSKTSNAGSSAGGKQYNISFKDGKIASKLEETGTVGQPQHRHTIRFWPDPKFFDSDKFLRRRSPATPQGEGGAVPGPARHVQERSDGEKDEWSTAGSRRLSHRGAGQLERIPPSSSPARVRATTTRSTTTVLAPDAPAPIGEATST